MTLKAIGKTKNSRIYSDNTVKKISKSLEVQDTWCHLTSTNESYKLELVWENQNKALDIKNK